MNARQADGATLREHYAVLAARRGRMPDEAVAPEVPEAALYLWQWFGELARGRGGSGFGPNPISWQDIRAWGDLTGIEPTVFEVECLMAIDQAYLNGATASKQKGKHGD